MLLWLLVLPLQLGCFAIIWFGCELWLEEILYLVLYPALIYLTFQMPIHNKALSYLGSLSFGLYAFQCVTRALRELGLITDVWVIFIVIVLLSVLEDLAKRIYKRRAKRTAR